jgi:hypothetical protein
MEAFANPIESDGGRGECMAEIYTMMLVTTVLGGAGLLSYVMYWTGAFRKPHRRRERMNLR